MVDDDLVLVREDSKECERIQSLKEIQLKEWSMVVIRDSPTHDDCSIFPPINHENLPISEQNEQHPLSPSSSSSSSSSPSSSSPPPNPFSSSSSLSSSPSDSTASDPQPAPPPSDSRVKRAGEVTRWIGVGLEVIRCKVFAFVSSFRNYDATKGAFWSFSPVAAAAVVFWMFVLARQRRRRVQSKGRLMQAIKEKDEKITQLLHQIARMNEVLVAHHRDLISTMSK
ncbi:uncharacterized protein LOC112023035 [Quercus suber]|uniref:uncharacterized protein LOC112023035 n=1 Tax=Quercus suber TaxID=58331 RepID=UPI000CE1CBAF|nr:uncharacterized protein LOC112023035 [Quercus suber]POF11664.1 hypothetical protein CFP56_62240 [Quercus suber]